MLAQKRSSSVTDHWRSCSYSANVRALARARPAHEAGQPRPLPFGRGRLPQRRLTIGAHRGPLSELPCRPIAPPFSQLIGNDSYKLKTPVCQSAHRRVVKQTLGRLTPTHRAGPLSSHPVDAPALRAQFPVLSRVAYLNAGTDGPLPAAASRQPRGAGARGRGGPHARSFRTPRGAQHRRCVARTPRCSAAPPRTLRSRPAPARDSRW